MDYQRPDLRRVHSRVGHDLPTARDQRRAEGYKWAADFSGGRARVHPQRAAPGHLQALPLDERPEENHRRPHVQ